MKLKITYATKEKKYITKNTYQVIFIKAELEPLRILRSPCGKGKAANRYYYFAEFKAPKDAGFAIDGVINEPINRKDNPKFKPKCLNWTRNFCDV